MARQFERNGIARTAIKAMAQELENQADCAKKS